MKTSLAFALIMRRVSAEVAMARRDHIPDLLLMDGEYKTTFLRHDPGSIP